MAVWAANHNTASETYWIDLNSSSKEPMASSEFKAVSRSVPAPYNGAPVEQVWCTPIMRGHLTNGGAGTFT